MKPLKKVLTLDFEQRPDYEGIIAALQKVLSQSRASGQPSQKS